MTIQQLKSIKITTTEDGKYYYVIDNRIGYIEICNSLQEAQELFNELVSLSN